MIDRFVGSALDYSNMAPENFPHRTKLWEFLPMGTYTGSIGTSDIVRFNIKTDEFWDPWSTFMEITVDVSQNPFLTDDSAAGPTGIHNKLLQLDSSAQSFFKQMVIYDNNEELERIMEYDTLAAMLKDISSGTSDRYNKDYEGLGGAVNTSFVSNVSSAARTPNLNDGAVKAMKYFQPADNPFEYVDATNQTSYGIGAGFNNRYYTTTNHVANMTQSAFQPFLNRPATCYGGGNNVLDYCSDFTFRYIDGTQPDTDPYTIGLTNAYTPAFGCNGYEPVFSTVVPQRYMQSGVVRAATVTTATFQVPLLSAIFGFLVPPNCYKLIPMKYFRDLVFEFTISPYALFSSFFNTAVNARGFVIKGIKLKTELVNVSDPIILAAVAQQYQQGIKLPSQQWSMGPLAPIFNNLVPPTLQINLGFESLRDILFCFIPNDYTANSGCRKQYRLSMCITSMQLKVGTEYYPQIAIQGNAGNNLGSITNNEFIRHLWKSFGKHLSPGDSAINPHNFAVNCRAFDPTTTDIKMTGDWQYGHFEENRVIGKACFSLNLDALNYENKTLSGLNTQFCKPFELLLNYDGSKPFPRNCTMFTFFRHDVALVLSPSGNKIYGRN